MNRYTQCEKIWDDVFENQEISVVNSTKTGNEAFDYGMKWVCEKATTVLDFGCGNGTALFISALYGSKYHIGIDLSQKAIMRSKIGALKMHVGKYNFTVGGIEELDKIADNAFDAIILSNIIDNLYPEDTKLLLSEIKRVLRKNGRVLIKLNPYITKEQLAEWNLKVDKNNVLNDGLILWNQTTQEWRNLISEYFVIEHYMDVPYTEQNQINRMFLVSKL